MKNFYTEEQWNEILKQQESVLRYDTFTRKQALELGLLIAEVTEKKYHGSVAVRIVEDETTVFAYKMEEASWKVREENFFVCGGCIPVFMRDGSRPFAYVMVSGMEHWDDHQVIADAMAKQLRVEIPEVQKEQP